MCPIADHRGCQLQKRILKAKIDNYEQNLDSKQCEENNVDKRKKLMYANSVTFSVDDSVCLAILLLDYVQFIITNLQNVFINVKELAYNFNTNKTTKYSLDGSPAEKNINLVPIRALSHC